MSDAPAKRGIEPLIIGHDRGTTLEARFDEIGESKSLPTYPNSKATLFA